MTPRHLRLPAAASILAGMILSGCVYEPPPHRVIVAERPAPPPVIVEPPPPPPPALHPYWVWRPGRWVWEGRWVWHRGHYAERLG
ncbi:hypothetical protein FHR90_001027 [Endobacter medicaginis]|uniref:YXWGXW repeat-containing protein n=1 Tax=Endobacter medicaginis TaxID=1181271 RepID=A0A839V0Y8_9PROT|nr:hypothetical protein [Endobacter medicaginis]MBB3173209.1 hypothetical protein [Endobacter medicaginis]NVN29957.1 hypothetical protein [Endobacter medicaginis]